MKVAYHMSAWRLRREPLVLAAGYFDGLHRGHRKVIDLTIARARQLGGEAWILTLDAHPLELLRPARAPRLLTSTRHKLERLAEMDVDGCTVLRFTRALAALTPEQFVDMLLRNAPRLTDVFVGENWRFGRGRSGTPARLMQLGRERGFGVTVVSPLRHGGRVISSSRIRSCILAGEFSTAEALLGRPFSVLGKVRKGRSLGRKLGFPTANLDTENEVLPPRGVYAVRARILADPGRAGPMDGVVNLGLRPTFDTDRKEPVLELHLFDFRRSLYGQEIEVFFLRKLRAERRFPDGESLRDQIRLDIARGRKLLC